MTPKEAVVLQKVLADQVEEKPSLEQFDLIAGADVSFTRFSKIFFASVVVLRARDFSVVECKSVRREVQFPYVPGLLSFREAPVLLDAFAKLRSNPDVVMIDGHGLAHPRRFGIAAHMGLWLQIPCIGCAKSLLCGTFKDPPQKICSFSPLTDKEETIGRVVRTRQNVKPVFISVGHRIDLASAVQVALQMCRGYRIPEPTRLAHHYVNAFRKENGQ